MKGQEVYLYENNVDVSDMPDQLSCFLVLPFDVQQACKKSNFNAIPYVITFRDQETLLGEIMNDYRRNADCMIKYQINFTLRTGKLLNEDWSISMLKNLLVRESLNRTVLFTKINYKRQLNPENIFYERPTQIYYDQCCVIYNLNPRYKKIILTFNIVSLLAFSIIIVLLLKVMNQQKEFGSKYIKIIVQMPTKTNAQKEVMTIQIGYIDQGKELLKAILAELKKNYNLNLKEDQLDVFVNDTGQKLQLKADIIKQNIYAWSTVTVEFKKPVQLRRTVNFKCNNFIIIYKENDNEKPIKLEFAKIADMTFKELYESKLVLEESKNRKFLAYGLKIMDMIVAPHQKLIKAAPYFQLQTTNTYSIVAKVINQKMIFNYLIPKLQSDKQQFLIDKLIKIPKEQSNKRDEIRKKTLDRIKVMKNDYFKKVETLEPILIYTSDLIYCEDERTNANAKVYESLNRFLRETPVLSLNQETFRKEWRYKYTQILLKHLLMAQENKGDKPVYRGVGYNPQFKKGEIITFKQFTSTSTNKKVAVNFAMASSNRMKYMMKLKIEHGYNIRQFSKFMNEDEVLIKPFSEFEVLQITQNYVQEVNNKNVPFTLYELRQIIRIQQLPKIKANFIVWVDHNLQEGKQIFNKLNIPKQTTILNLLSSTQQLKSWLEKYRNLKDESTANFIFITNMTRKEGNIWNQIAGIQALRQIRKFKKDINVFFYVGDIGKAEKKLAENKVNDQNILVGQSPKQIANYINLVINSQT